METAIIQIDSKEDMKLLLALAKKLGATAQTVSEAEAEDIGLIRAIKEGRTGQSVDTNKFLKKLRGE
jgi:hypothetical protein